MIRWLQTSLFGRAPDQTAIAEPKQPPQKSPSSARSQAVADPEFTVRWHALSGGTDITLELVPRLRQGWKMTWRRGGGALLRAPRIFRDAPDEVLLVLSSWARLVLLRKSPGRTAERRALEKTLHAWIEARHQDDAHTLKLKRGRAARRLARLDPKGRHHDLEAVLRAVTTEYFGDAPEVAKARITWSARWGGLSTQTTAYDAEGKPYPLLCISRGYDHSTATADIVGGVVYHECLHIAVPPELKNGRRVVHGREFRRREKEYRFYDVWRAWHAQKLPGIVRRGNRG
jgi:hypothetical protein